MTRAIWTHLVKDLRIEWRSKDAINSMLFFALLVGPAARHVGFGRQRTVLRPPLPSQPQTRTAAATHSVSHFLAGIAGHGAGHYIDPLRRRRPIPLDQVPPGLRHHLQNRQPAS